MLRVGVTGGIGAGKSMVCEIFRILGVPVYDADKEARLLIDTNPDIRRELTDVFGTDVYTPVGLDRKKVAAIVFNDKEKLEQLNAITHPKVFEHHKQWLSKQQALYTIKEAALLFESKSYKDLDFIITVTAPEALRIARVVQRDGLDEPEIVRRIENQMPGKEKAAASHFVIENDGEKPLIPQVVALHQQLLSLAETQR